MKKILILISMLFLVISCAPNIQSPYYTSPSGGGYNQQVIGAKCSSCGRQMNISWNQYNNVEAVSCPYCGAHTNTKQACATFKYESDQRNAQAWSNAIKNVGDSYSESQKNKANMYKSNSSSCQYKSWTTTVGTTMLHCTQYSNCNVNCF